MFPSCANIEPKPFYLPRLKHACAIYYFLGNILEGWMELTQYIFLYPRRCGYYETLRPIQW